MSQFVLPELNAMQQIANIVASLSTEERKRVASWLVEYASQEAPETVEEPDGSTHSDAVDNASTNTADESLEMRFTTFGDLYSAVSPKKGAQKAAVAGYWLETEQGQRSWKASEVNKLLKSIDVKVSSISIVLTNAVKVDGPLIMELERMGDGERSRKTFCLSERGLAYVEGASGKTA